MKRFLHATRCHILKDGRTTDSHTRTHIMATFNFENQNGALKEPRAFCVKQIVPPLSYTPSTSTSKASGPIFEGATFTNDISSWLPKLPLDKSNTRRTKPSNQFQIKNRWSYDIAVFLLSVFRFDNTTCPDVESFEIRKL